MLKLQINFLKMLHVHMQIHAACCHPQIGVSFLDEPSTGPMSYGGGIQKELMGCSSLSVLDFQHVSTNLEHTNVTDLSSDQKYLLFMVCTIESGVFLPDKAKCEPGYLVHCDFLPINCYYTPMLEQDMLQRGFFHL